MVKVSGKSSHTDSAVAAGLPASLALQTAPHAFRMGDNGAMQQIWLALIGGLILGWLIEWMIDWWFWRRNLAELRQENQELRRQLEEMRGRLDSGEK